MSRFKNMAGNMLKCPMIVINASEVASVIKEHPFKSREEIMLKIWERTDQRTFCIVNAVQNKSEVSRILKLSEEKAKDEVRKEQFSSLLFQDWDKHDDTFIQVLKEIFPEEGIPKPFVYPLRWKILKAMRCHTNQDFCEKTLLREAQVDKIVIEEAKKLCENENKPISKSVEEICKKKGIENEAVKKALDSTLTKDRGTKLESKTVEVFGQEKGIKFEEVPQKTVSKVMEYEGIQWLLQGRADALMTDKVIEVKNRKNRFMQPLYDLIQLQVYLYLYERPKGILLERFRKDNKETPVTFKDNYWKDEVVPALKNFVLELQNHVEKNLSLLRGNECKINISGPGSPPKRPSTTIEEAIIMEKKTKTDEDEEDFFNDSLDMESLNKLIDWEKIENMDKEH